MVDPRRRMGQTHSSDDLRPAAVRLVRAALRSSAPGGDMAALRMTTRNVFDPLTKAQRLALVAVLANMAARLVAWMPEDERERLLTAVTEG